MSEKTWLNEFQAAMEAAGLSCKEPLIPDGNIHRFKIGDDTKSNSWYVFSPGERPTGSFGCWKRGIKQEWRAEEFKKCDSPTYKQAWNSQKNASYQEMRERANTLWQKGITASPDHPYVLKKAIQPYQVKSLDEQLIIPLQDEKDIIWSLQFIHPDGSKKFLKGGRKKGLFYTLGEKENDKIYLCEGYATACTVHTITGMRTVIAFDAQNLLPVAKILRTCYPDKEIILCADNDQFTDSNPGLTKAREAAQAIHGNVVFPVFASLETEPTDFNDLCLLEGSDIVKHQLSQAASSSHESLTLGSFIVKDEGVFYVPAEEGTPFRICGRLDILARTHDEHGRNHGKLLEFWDPSHKKYQWVMPMEMLAGDGTEYRRILLDRGLEIAGGHRARDRLTQYLSSHCPKKLLLCVSQTGWHKDTFVLTDQAIGPSPDTLLLQNLQSSVAYSTAGTLAEWQAEVAAYCKENSRLLFALGAAFAAATLYLLQEESGGFHFLGASSIGKTTLLNVAASVWGGPDRLQRWRATSNGLEAMAALHNDSLLCLDEIGQVDPREIGEMAYLLANGSGKGRCLKDGSMRQKNKWRLIFLSSGETGLSDHILQGGKKMRAGQEVRFVDIPADAGSNLGIFEDLHHFESGSLLARHLNTATKQYYGSAIRQYLSQIIQDFDAAKQFLQHARTVFLQANTSTKESGQVYRVALRFSLIAAAGELASSYGITNMQENDMLRGVSQCFHDWIDERGGTGSKEDMLALAQVRCFFEKHGEARFSPWYADQREQKTANRVGFRRGSDFFVLPEVFKQDICAGLNPRFVAQLCLARGWLIGDSQGRALSSQRLPDTGKTTRVYHFCDKVFDDEIA